MYPVHSSPAIRRVPLAHRSNGFTLIEQGLIFTAVYSRHMFVWPTYRQTLGEVIAGFEAV